MSARNEKAYVWQLGRFLGDVQFWQQGLRKPQDVKPVKEGECLRLYLTTADDFRFFHDSATEKLQSSNWLGGSPDEELEEVEAE
jgi:hypothetical protein